MITVHGFSPSGNCHKVKLLLEQLGHGYRWVETDSARGATRTPEYLAKNPNGKVPMIERDDGCVLVESNAILCWLAEGTAFLPADPWQKAQALSWLFFEQYSHEPYVAVARFIQLYQGLPAERQKEYEECHVRGYKALKVMELQLSRTPYLVGEHYSIADIALYAYTHVADEGGFDLTPYPAVRGWLERVASHPRHVGMLD